MMMSTVRPAVRFRELNTVTLNLIDRADVHPISADHFHVLGNFVEVGHLLFLSSVGESNARSGLAICLKMHPKRAQGAYRSSRIPSYNVADRHDRVFRDKPEDG